MKYVSPSTNFAAETQAETLPSKPVAPSFKLHQQVYFLGERGTIKDYRSDSGTWAYAVEMELGPEPEMGRMGFETTILLHETEIQDGLN